MNSNQKAPLSPQQLFNRLFNGDFKSAQCQDEVTKIRQQREILIQLIVEYEDQIKKAQLMAKEEEKLIILKERLLVELEALKNQRLEIDDQLNEQLNSIRVTPLQVRDQQSWLVEVNEARTRNNKLKIRIRDLMGYIQKLEIQNRRLQQERRVLQVTEIQRKQVGQDWRTKIDFLKREHLSYETELRQKIKKKEQQALRNIKMQEMQIQERNQRRRMECLSGRTPITKGVYALGSIPTSRYMRQI